MLTHGYVGLGFSNNGRMKGSDIVIGWIKEDSTPFLDVSLVIPCFDRKCSLDLGHKNSKFTKLFLRRFQDRHSTGHKVPLIDTSQDYKLLKGYQNDTHTVLRFSRLWDTCDKVI